MQSVVNEPVTLSLVVNGGGAVVKSFPVYVYVSKMACACEALTAIIVANKAIAMQNRRIGRLPDLFLACRHKNAAPTRIQLS